MRSFQNFYLKKKKKKKKKEIYNLHQKEIRWIQLILDFFGADADFGE